MLCKEIEHKPYRETDLPAGGDSADEKEEEEAEERNNLKNKPRNLTNDHP